MTMRQMLFSLTIAAGAFAGAALAEDPAMYADSSLGKVLVDAKGMTLYTFDKDSGGASACYDTCAQNWPPMAAAADAKPVGDYAIIDRTDGTKQWTYDGKPLYTFIKDSKAGDVTGDGVKGVWHVIKE